MPGRCTAATADLDLRERSDEEVRRERDTLAERLSDGPGDPTSDLDRLRDQWAPLEHAVADATRERDTAHSRLRDGGLRRSERHALEETVAAAGARIRFLEERLAELAPHVRRIGEEHRRWREWAVAAEPELRRYLLVEGELGGRAREAARWARAVEVGEVLDIAGRRPDGYGARSRWRHAIDLASTYAVRWGAKAQDRGPEVPVGDLEVARERQARRVEQALAAITRNQELARSVERDTGPSM